MLDAFTIEVAVRFDPDSMNTFRIGFRETQVVIAPQAITFSLLNATLQPDSIDQLRLSTKNFQGLSGELYDGQWHHLAFVFRGKTGMQPGRMTIFIDGKTHPEWQKPVSAPGSYTTGTFVLNFIPRESSSANRADELALWTTALPDTLISRHSRDFSEGKHYSTTYNKSDPPAAVFAAARHTFASADYAPGYPSYSVDAGAQLLSYPLPRYRPGTSLQRNFPWFDFAYLSYDYHQAYRVETGKFKYPGWNEAAHARAALAIDSEMYVHWHYYFLLPSPTYNFEDFSRRGTIAGELTHYADLHPEVKTATVLFWVGVHPDRAGFSSKAPYIRSNSSIAPCESDTLYPGIAKDGLTQRRNIDALVKMLPHRDPLCKIDFVNENGEVFGESRTPNAEGYRGSPLIHCIQRDSSAARFDRARWQLRVFSTYTSQFANTKTYPELLQSHFSFYQVAGFLPQYYPQYTVMRRINTKMRGSYYSTPDFYPGHKTWNIWETHGPYHGLDAIRQGRAAELAAGDPYFSPFVCAGWFSDSLNFRPAEWLASLKALGMMGAEFYYPAYFNIANPSDHLPQDPRGYMYQVVMPCYAQAVTSRMEKLFFRSKGFVYQRNFNRVLVYRKDSTAAVYAIHASVFGGNGTAAAITGEVNIDGTILTLKFLPQGATYIYDKSDPANVIFYQLDAWHEPTHPYYWSKDFAFEAEVSDDSFPHVLRTERPENAAANDYTTYTTFVRFSKESQPPLVFDFEPRQEADSVYYIWVRARSVLERSSLLLTIDGKTRVGITAINNGKFSWYCVEMKGKPMPFDLQSGKPHELKIEVKESFVDVDKVLISHSAKMPEN